jgi:hypothetical protein
MPLCANCPASISGEGVQVDSFDPTATDGVEVHRAIALALRGKEYPAFEGVNAGENEDMLALALAYVRAQSWGKCDVKTEVHIDAPPFSATLDLLCEIGDVANLADFKTTYREDNHEAQILAQAFCAFHKYPHLQAADTHVVFLRNEGVIRKRYTREWVGAWAEEFIHNTLSYPEIYRPGDWCGRCRRKIECPALKAQRRAFAEMLLTNGTGIMNRDNVPEIRTKGKLIRDLLDTMNDMIRDEVLAHGAIPMGDGKELAAIEINPDEIHILKAWNILQAEFTDEQMASFVEVGKTKLLDLIKAEAPRGQKTKAAEAFMEALRAAGAVTQKQQVQVRVRNIRE